MKINVMISFNPSELLKAFRDAGNNLHTSEQ